MFLTWVMVSPSGAPSICVLLPQKSAVNRPALNPTAAMAMNTRIGTTLAMVTTTLTNAAVWTPRRVMACTIHSTIDAPMIAGNGGAAFEGREEVAQRREQQHEVGDVAHPGRHPVAEGRREADVVAETGSGVAVDAAVDVRLAGGQCLEDERQHQHADTGDRPADEKRAGSGAACHLRGQGEDAAADHRPDDDCGQGGKAQAATCSGRTGLGRLGNQGFGHRRLPALDGSRPRMPPYITDARSAFRCAEESLVLDHAAVSPRL